MDRRPVVLSDFLSHDSMTATTLKGLKEAAGHTMLLVQVWSLIQEYRKATMTGSATLPQIFRTKREGTVLFIYLFVFYKKVEVRMSYANLSL